MPVNSSTDCATMTISGISVTKSALLVSVLDNVEGKLWKFRLDGRRWVRSVVEAPAQGTVSLTEVSRNSDRFFFTYSSFLQPTTLYVHEANGRIREVQRLPAQFDARDLVIEQLRARSTDGTQVPYFVVHKKPDGTFLGRSAIGEIDKDLPKGALVTMRNWNTIEKAAAL